MAATANRMQKPIEYLAIYSIAATVAARSSSIYQHAPSQPLGHRSAFAHFVISSAPGALPTIFVERSYPIV